MEKAMISVSLSLTNAVTGTLINFPGAAYPASQAALRLSGHKIVLERAIITVRTD
jgi:hypothetical protein